MKNNWLVVSSLVASLFLTSSLTLAQTPSNESLSSLMGAVNQIISDNTKIPGVKEDGAKITPPGEKVLKTLEGDLEACQTVKTVTPEVVGVQKDGVSVNFKKFDIKIYGDKCPLEMTASLNAPEQGQDVLEANFLMKVVFKTDTLIQKYKMRYVEVSGTIGAKATKTADTVHLPVHMVMAAKGDSLDLGAISQTMTADITVDANLAQFSFAMTAEQTAILQYSGKTQKGYSRTTMNGFSQPELLFTIDDKTVSQSEFQTFLQTFALPSVVSSDDQQGPDGKAPASCSFVVYDKKNISAADLKTQMTNGTLPTAGQLTKGQSCMKDMSVPFQQAQQALAGQMTFGTDWISFSATTKAAPEANPPSVYVLYGDEAVQTQETANLVLGLQCKAVPACQ